MTHTGPRRDDQAHPVIEASAPGRVNLIGEHTDYNDGFMLPVPIPQRTVVQLTPRYHDDLVTARSAEQAEPAWYALGEEQRRGTWVDYVQGVTLALRARGHVTRGFDAVFRSEVPMGAGLSSSAALEVSLLRALREAFQLELSDVEIAQVGRAAEVDFIGVPIGIMDQMAASLGRPGNALFIDARSLETREVALPSDLELVVIASGVTHAHDGGQYKQRRDECARAAAALCVPSLRDVTLEQLESAALPATLSRRARHVITENERVLDTITALAHGDRLQLRSLFAASHRSMRDDYQISVPEIDLLVSLGMDHSQIVAARLTGGGFGGSVVMLATHGGGREAAEDISRAYHDRCGRSASILLPTRSTHGER